MQTVIRYKINTNMIFTLSKILRQNSSNAKSISIKECHPIFFYHLKKQLYCLYHTILQFLLHQKILFLLKYYYLIFLYYFFYPIFYFRRDSISWAFQPFLFFLRLPQPLAKTTNTYHQTHAVSVGAASTTTLSLNRFFFSSVSLNL